MVHLCLIEKTPKALMSRDIHQLYNETATCVASLPRSLDTLHLRKTLQALFLLFYT